MRDIIPLPHRRRRVVATSSGGTDSGIMDVAKTLASGTMGGIAQVLAGHPFDTVKTKLQIQSSGAHYRGMMHCFKEVVRTEGLLGLYKGALSPLVGAMAHNGNVFFSFSMAKKAVGAVTGTDELTVAQTTAAGSLAAITICAVEVPVDLFKIKLQGQGAQGTYTGSFDAARSIFRQYGIRGCYQGAGATALRNIPAFGAYFGAFEFMRRAMTPEGERPTLFASFVGGSAAGFAFWASVYPLEMVKTRMQAEPSDIALRRYTGSLDCLRKCIAEEGAAALFKGFVPCITRAVPVNGAIFLAVAYAKSLLSDEDL